MSNQHVYDIVTAKICEALERGVVPWRQPWDGGTPLRFDNANATTRKCYRGINALVTFAVRHVYGYQSNLWLTFRQAQEMGGHVKRGEKSTPVLYYSTIERDEIDESTGEAKRIPFVRYYSVFNIAQCEGLPFSQAELFGDAPRVRHEWEAIEECERIIADMPTPPEIQHSPHAGAFYRPAEDIVVLPNRERFRRATDYYATAFHELTHATRHSTRLDRRDRDEAKDAGRSHYCGAYAREELVAEIGAAFLCGAAGIEPATLDDSASYIAHWLQVLKNDSRLIASAAAHAQRAADFILGASASERAIAA